MGNLQYDPSLSQAWITWTTFESMIQDFERVRAIFELAVKQALDMPELVWKAYIDFEAEQGERERTRHLYERLLEKTGHVKVSLAALHLNYPQLTHDIVLYRAGLHLLRAHGSLQAGWRRRGRRGACGGAGQRESRTCTSGIRERVQGSQGAWGKRGREFQVIICAFWKLEN
jgi:hypothetical protein